MESLKMTSNEAAALFAKTFAELKAPAKVIPYLVAQVAYETGDFKSKLLKDHNNASGIVYTGRASQKNAVKGRPLPEDGRYFYAKFATLNDWAKDYMRVLNLKAKPIQATSADDFITRLKSNGYFTAPVELYKKGFDKYLKKYGSTTAPAAGAGVIILLIGLTFLILR
jgi:hypothetical protein